MMHDVPISHDLAQPAARILIVEDDDLSRDAMIELLGMKRYDIVGAADLAEARRLLRDPLPDIVLLDLMLPDGFGSYVLRYIREAGLAIRVAVISAAYDMRLLTDVANLRPDAFFTKPVELRAVMEWIEHGPRVAAT